ncbi:MAG TPA: hypothetical protein VGT41_02930 [Candidatus Babeliales bacterium]|nr:hypothetical protein [Candidatus Babeliales bacterium]
MKVAGPSQDGLEFKKNYIKMNPIGSGLYWGKNHTTNEYVDTLSILFNDQGSDAEWVKEALLNSTGRGMSGEYTRILVKGDKVILKPTSILYDEPEEHIIEMDRNVLLRLTNDWQALVKAKAPEIFIYEKDEELFVSDTLPEGME